MDDITGIIDVGDSQEWILKGYTFSVPTFRRKVFRGGNRLKGATFTDCKFDDILGIWQLEAEGAVLIRCGVDYK